MKTTSFVLILVILFPSVVPSVVNAEEIQHRGSGLTQAQRRIQSRDDSQEQALLASGISGIYINNYQNYSACAVSPRYRGDGCNDRKNRLKNEMLREHQKK